MKRIVNRFKVVFVLLILSLCGGALLYSASLRHSSDCRADVIFDDADINTNDLNAFRYVLMGKISSEYFSNEDVQKQALLVDKIKEKIIIISQVRISSSKGLAEEGFLESRLAKAFLDVEKILGSRLISKNIQCHNISRWFEFLAPLFFLSLSLFYVIARFFKNQRTSNS